MTPCAVETSEQHLRSGLVSQPRPQTVTCEATYGCNLNCVHCFNPTHTANSRELSTDDLKHVIDQLAAAGTLYFGFTGGEALTRPDLFELLVYAKGKGMLVSLLTNATLVTPDKADRLAALELYRVDVSLYGATAATYEAVTRVQGSFAKFVRGLDLLLERKIPVRLKTIIVTLNAHEMDAMRAFSESRGLHFEFLTNIQPKANGDPDPLQYRVTPEVAAQLWEEQTLRRNPDGTRRRYETTAHDDDACGMTTRGKLFTCGCGRSSCGISPYGEMNLCVAYHLPQYDLKLGSVAEGWEALKHYVDDAQPRSDFPCPTCPVERTCDRNVNHAILEMGDPNACVPYHLELATLKHARLAAPAPPALPPGSA